jgi:hypothetical protein
VWAPKVESMLDEWYEKDARRPRSERIVERGPTRKERNTSSPEPEPQAKRRSSPRASDRDRRGSDREKDERGHSRDDNYKPNSGRRQRERSPERGEKGRLSPQTELSFGER